MSELETPATALVSGRKKHYLLTILIALLSVSILNFFGVFDFLSGHPVQNSGGIETIFILLALILSHLERYYFSYNPIGKLLKGLYWVCLAAAFIFVFSSLLARWHT
jgi:hypothetical protein